jgi:CRP/FNR family cyclic AMP-dependent transcriptional regulator
MPREEISASEEETRSFLISLPIFSSFNVDELSILAKHMSFIHLQLEEHLFIEGDQGTFMGFVVNGILEVQKKAETGENMTLARLTKGSSIGEMALIDRSPRSATVVAKQATTMVTLTEKGFDLLAEKHPQIGVMVIKKIARLLSLNMRRTSSKLADLMIINT